MLLFFSGHYFLAEKNMQLFYVIYWWYPTEKKGNLYDIIKFSYYILRYPAGSTIKLLSVN